MDETWYLKTHMDGLYIQEYPDVFPNMEYSCEETFWTLGSLNDYSIAAQRGAQTSRFGEGISIMR